MYKRISIALAAVLFLVSVFAFKEVQYAKKLEKKVKPDTYLECINPNNHYDVDVVAKLVEDGAEAWAYHYKTDETAKNTHLYVTRYEHGKQVSREEILPPELIRDTNEGTIIFVLREDYKSIRFSYSDSINSYAQDISLVPEGRDGSDLTYSMWRHEISPYTVNHEYLLAGYFYGTAVPDVKSLEEMEDGNLPLDDPDIYHFTTISLEFHQVDRMTGEEIPSPSAEALQE